MTKFNAQDIHKEIALQEHFINQLVENQGYIRRAGSLKSRVYKDAVHYDKIYAMDRELVLRFIQRTQSDAWKRLRQHYKAMTEDTIVKQLDRALRNRGLLDVLRKGIKIVPNIEFKLCFFRPASGLESKRITEFESNILSIMDEVEYSKKHANRIDMVLFVNGLAVISIEAKNIPTGTNFRNAEKQFREDRSPLGEPLLQFKRGALVHFAIDEDNASMTTHLQNSKTRFLPFNRGNDGGAGNPDIDGEFRISYFYASGEWGDAILSKTVLLDILGRFAHIEFGETEQKLIFPRLHQLDSVRKMIAHSKQHGSGRNYLIQHSAGSGKSNTIAWLAHQIINLHDAEDRLIFNTAIVVTDRVILDRQLQNTVGQFEQTKGVVRKIDGTSRQLKSAILENARVIVTTMQKFSTEHLAAISGHVDRSFAVIVDEAHSGQSGKSAKAMSDVLSNAAVDSEEIEDVILAFQRARGPQTNVSFFAFTATPRNVTLERFGLRDESGLPRPFHLYSMRQAIEEGYILDVLQHYVTYEQYYRLEKSIDEDPRFLEKQARRHVARYATLHPSAIGQKVEIIIEHFRRHVKHELSGHAKAMLVTQSREHAYRYFESMLEFITRKNYEDLRILVAFSGELLIDGELKSEKQLNGFSELELPHRFDGFTADGRPYDESYSFLIVAEKYQTGFDQPKLCAMYIDRPLNGLQAVQTLSRLNRTYNGKKSTYILDFVNSVEDIRDAFKPYFGSTEMGSMSDANLIYDLQSQLFSYGILDLTEIEQFAQVYFKSVLVDSDRPILQGLVNIAIRRFNGEVNEKRKEEFRQTLRSYNRFYSFIAQVISLEDTELEKLYVFGEMLQRMLPSRVIPPDIAVTEEMLALRAYRADKTKERDASLSPGDTIELEPIREFSIQGYTVEERKELSEIVQEFNDQHGTDFSDHDMLRLDRVKDEIMDRRLIEMLRNNPPDVVYRAFDEAFMKGVIRSYKRDEDIKNIILKDSLSKERAVRHFFNRAIRQVHTAA